MSTTLDEAGLPNLNLNTYVYEYEFVSTVGSMRKFCFAPMWLRNLHL